MKIVAVATLLFGTSTVFTACNNEENELSKNQQGRYWKQENVERTPTAKMKEGEYGHFLVKRIIDGKEIEFIVWGFKDRISGQIDISTIREILTSDGRTVDILPGGTTLHPNGEAHFIVRDPRGNRDNDIHLYITYDEFVSFFVPEYSVIERD